MRRRRPTGPLVLPVYQGLMFTPVTSAIMNASMAFSLFFSPEGGKGELTLHPPSLNVVNHLLTVKRVRFKPIFTDRP